MSFLLSGAASAASIGAQAGFSALAAKKAFSRQKQILKNQIQWKVNDLEGAGLNKYLAVTGGMGGGGGNVSMASQISAPDPSKMVTTAKNIKTMSDEARLIKESADKAGFDKSRSALEVGIAGTNSQIAEQRLTQEGYRTLEMEQAKGLNKDRLGFRNRWEGGLYRTGNTLFDFFNPEQKAQNAAKRHWRKRGQRR